MKTQSGFTLVELMIVLGLAAVILSMVTMSFSRLNEKYTVESNTKNIYSILMRARNDAATTNTSHLVVLSANQVQTGLDANSDNVMDAINNTKRYQRYTINCAGIACAGNTVAFDARGLTNNLQTLSITGFAAGTPAMDCIVIAATRINIGKMTGPGPGGNCVQR
jgi:prepilin-type N-terminal cleavage/methylation domain-containing protein